MEVASHTALMDPILPELGSALADLAPQSPTIRFISTIADTPTPTLDAQYWVDNVRQPVRFSQAITTAAEEHGTFIEISPHPTLTHAITETLGSTRHHSIGTLWRDRDDTVSFHSNLNSTHSLRTHLTRPSRIRSCPPRPGITRNTGYPSRIRRGQPIPHPGPAPCSVSTSWSPPHRPHICGRHGWRGRPSRIQGRHRIHGAELVPVSVLLQTLSAAAAECDASALSDIRFEHPIVVDQPRVIQVVADGDSVTVSSSPAADAPGQRWVRHVSARITRRSDQDAQDRRGRGRQQRRSRRARLRRVIGGRAATGMGHRRSAVPAGRSAHASRCRVGCTPTSSCPTHRRSHCSTPPFTSPAWSIAPTRS